MSLAEVRLRIQVIDINPRQLDVTVPKYIPVSDLSQRVVRDAGMMSHWPNRFRRHYYIHARGRMLDPAETLESVGLVDGELIYLLPQPDAQLGVLEQNPEYPEVKPYLGQGMAQLMLSLSGMLVFSFLWGMALSVDQSVWTATLPSLGLSSLCVAVARHAWGGWAFSMRIGATAVVLYIIALLPPLLAPTMLSGIELSIFIRTFLAGAALGFTGLILSWIAWWGPVEPLNRVRVEEQRESEKPADLPLCGICNREVEISVQASCEYNTQCGRIFHKGCLVAKQSSFQGDPRLCPVCTIRIA